MAQVHIYTNPPSSISSQPVTFETSIYPLPTSEPSAVTVHDHILYSEEYASRRITSTGKGILIGMLSAFGSALLIAIVLVLIYLLRYTNRGRIFLDRIGRPGEYDDEQAFLKEEEEALQQMDDIQRSEYMRAKAFIQANPAESAQTDISLSQFLAIQEKGVLAWHFEPELEVANCFVEGRTEIEFFDSECSVQTNLPVPKQNDVYYWESKIYDKAETTTISIGMATKPYPLFRLPGLHKTSVAYLSPGHRRFNQPFTPTAPYGPPYVVGDVIGVGYRPRTGTVFFTRNGRKLDDVTHTLKHQNLFPTIGATGPCNIHVNFGQMGFVFIEANVKKWGLAPMTGSLAPPPPYGSEAGSILLEGGQFGVREGEGWFWSQNAGHGRNRSQQVRIARQQTPRSPGPVRSPTDISLAQLSLIDDDEENPDFESQEGDSTSHQPHLQQYQQPSQHRESLVDFVGALQASEGLQNLNLPPGLLDAHYAAAAAAQGPPPPEYESPQEEDNGRYDDRSGLGIDIRSQRRESTRGTSYDEDATPRPGMFMSGAVPRSHRQQQDEDRRPLLDGEDGHRQGSRSPPIPSYDVAVRNGSIV